jgi:hypothetical protein
VPWRVHAVLSGGPSPSAVLEAKCRVRRTAGDVAEDDDAEIHPKRRWTVSAIARHTGRGRKTDSKYLKRPAGARRPPAPSCVEPFRGYLEARFDEDPG